MTEIKIKRVYDTAEKTDGFRILVDRLWPRGIKKENAHVDVWMKEVAPSTELRKWFDHDPEKWKQFFSDYTKELKHSNTVKELADQIKQHNVVTLLYAAKDEQHNQAVVLQKFLQVLLK
ncbi:MAG: DUF488 domain-containing protein [Ilyomonas sp.]